MKFFVPVKNSIHFIGVNGSGMSGIARLCASFGAKISGSDLCPRSNYLDGLDIDFFEGHKTENLKNNPEIVVYSSAVSNSNCELLAAKERGALILSRGEVLAQIMQRHTAIGVCGSHGKTSTTAFIASALKKAELDPTIFLGASISWLKSTAHLGNSGLMVAETDESDGSFLLTKPDYTVVTNVDNEHLATYGSFESLCKAFLTFLQKTPFYGKSIIGIDNVVSRDMASKISRKITYALTTSSADITAKNIIKTNLGSVFDIYYKRDKITSCTINLLGDQMVTNSLAAFALGLELGLNPQDIADGIESCKYISRRSEFLINSDKLTVINDYAHHPNEVIATLNGIANWRNSLTKGRDRRVVAVFEPHRFSRLKECLSVFSEAFYLADLVFLTDIFSAGETNDANITVKDVAIATKHKNIQHIPNNEELIPSLKHKLTYGDIVVFMGAGDIDRIARLFCE
jgi:UDP-N-acetylmuramate--alanine ligase